MAAKKWWEDEDDVDTEKEKEDKEITPDLLTAFVGDMKKSQGTQPISDKPPEKVNVYPQKDGKILSGPPAEKEVVQPGGNVVRFFDDKTDRHEYSTSDLVAMALIGLGTPMLGHHFGGKQGGFAGAASAGKALSDMMVKEEDRANRVADAKALNKSKILTARELATLGQKGGTGKVGTFQWIKGSNKNGEPVYYRVNRTTGDVDKVNTIAGYSKEFYENQPQKDGNVYDSDGVAMPAPDGGTGKTGASLDGGEKPPKPKASDDRTFDYTNEPPEKKPAGVPDKLPKGESKVTEDEAKNTAQYLADQRLGEIESTMPDARELDPTPKNGESIASGKARAEAAKKLRDDLNKETAALKKDLLDAQQQIEKEDRGEGRAKRISAFRKQLEKHRIMKNAEGQLVDVDDKDGAKPLAGANPKKPPATAGGGRGSAAQQAKQEDKVIQFDTAIASMRSVLNKLGDNSNWVGAVDGRVATLNPEESAFRSELGQMNDAYRHMITGAGAGNKELAKLESRMPSEKDLSLKIFKAKALDYIDKVEREKAIYMKGHNMSPDAEAIKVNLNEQHRQVESKPDVIQNGHTYKWNAEKGKYE